MSLSVDITFNSTYVAAKLFVNDFCNWCSPKAGEFPTLGLSGRRFFLDWKLIAPVCASEFVVKIPIKDVLDKLEADLLVI